MPDPSSAAAKPGFPKEEWVPGRASLDTLNSEVPVNSILEDPSRLHARLQRDLFNVRRDHTVLEARFEAEVQSSSSRIQSLDSALARALSDLDRVHGSAGWRVLVQARRLTAFIPPTLRKLIRRSARLLWWIVTLKLRRRLSELRQARFRPPESPCVPAPLAGQIADYDPHILSEAVLRLERFAAFDPAAYGAMHRDSTSTGLSPSAHAFCYGAQEGRALFTHEAIARALGLYSTAREGEAAQPGFRSPLTAGSRGHTLGLYRHSAGEEAVTIFAENLAVKLRTAGADIRLLDETSDLNARPGVTLVIAPHEFFYGEGGRIWRRQDVVTGSFMLNTEPLQSPGFARAVPFLMAARGVIDVTPQLTEMLADAGVPALSLSSGLSYDASPLTQEDRDHPLFRVLPKAVKKQPDPAAMWTDRDVAVMFSGDHTPYRERVLAGYAPRLAEYACFLHCRRLPGSPSGSPFGARRQKTDLSRLYTHVTGHSKILLDIHADEFGSAEWHGLAERAAWTGSVLVTEGRLPHGLLRAGEHYFKETPRYTPDLIDWLLKSADGQETARRVCMNNQALLTARPDPFFAVDPLMGMLWGNRV
ncbi:hypothetical protein C0V97_02955 [Asaia sp. W19]|uniref:hypothetical protein n=1 Tax=unclassified Asaia TaxID=2685023 RepID=UPI000F8DA544|nr:hypothetical protein [Asaia sp. W19]RUT27187.1 hypothetical protein C0V97_02955 [Asaia sp. W19]